MGLIPLPSTAACQDLMRPRQQVTGGASCQPPEERGAEVAILTACPIIGIMRGREMKTSNPAEGGGVRGDAPWMAALASPSAPPPIS